MATLFAKSIKPKKLKVDEVRLRLLNALRKEGTAVQKEFRKTVTAWQGATPTFETIISLQRGDATLIVIPVGSEKAVSKWIFLDQGTDPHPIVARRVPNLIFRDGSGFRAKTRAKTFSSGPGANTGPWIKKKQVQHPGIQAREWSKEIIRRRNRIFIKRMTEAARV